MTEKGLIKKIQELKSVKPRKDWVLLTKNQILGEVEAPKLSLWEVLPRTIFQYKATFATLVIIGLLAGTFGFAQKSLPGDFLYTLKKVTEKTRLSFVSEKERPNLQLEYANERLENLVKVAQTRETKKFALIIEEYQTSVSEAVESLAKVKEPDVKRIVQKTKEIEENKQKIEALGVIVGGTEDLDDALAQIYAQYVEREIKNLEESTLSERQEELLEKVKEDYKEGNYSEALEGILFLSYPQEK